MQILNNIEVLFIIVSEKRDFIHFISLWVENLRDLYCYLHKQMARGFLLLLFADRSVFIVGF